LQLNYTRSLYPRNCSFQLPSFLTEKIETHPSKPRWKEKENYAGSKALSASNKEKETRFTKKGLQSRSAAASLLIKRN
jgi:hypothetical protein